MGGSGHVIMNALLHAVHYCGSGNIRGQIIFKILNNLLMILAYNFAFLFMNRFLNTAIHLCSNINKYAYIAIDQLSNFITSESAIYTNAKDVTEEVT